MKEPNFDAEFAQELLPGQVGGPLSSRHAHRFETSSAKNEKNGENKRHSSKSEENGR